MTLAQVGPGNPMNTIVKANCTSGKFLDPERLRRLRLLLELKLLLCTGTG